jgi:hypothetical protein
MDWTDQSDAVHYKITVSTPDGQKINIESATSDAALNLDYLPAGEYVIEVAAFDASGNQICVIGAVATRREAISTNPEKPGKNKEDNSGPGKGGNGGQQADPTPAPPR